MAVETPIGSGPDEIRETLAAPVFPCAWCGSDGFGEDEVFAWTQLYADTDTHAPKLAFKFHLVCARQAADTLARLAGRA